jgi:hypothetical protein
MSMADKSGACVDLERVQSGGAILHVPVPLAGNSERREIDPAFGEFQFEVLEL